jgi:transglutaminase-like putative cysteine protease
MSLVAFPSRRSLLCTLAVCLATLPALAHPQDGKKEPATPRSREFLFTYAATVEGLKPGQTARIWLPVPPSNSEQEASIVTSKLPAKGQHATEPRFGNSILSVEARAGADGTIPVSVTYRVKRKEVIGNLQSTRVTAAERELFLKPDAKVPVGGKPAAILLKGKELPSDGLKLGKLLYDIVNDHMQYSKKGTEWGQGDAVWACDSKYGNCSDFHSLFISLARTEQLPAKFEIGFPLPEKHGKGTIGGYHCWAKFTPDGKTWIPVDISAANQLRAKDPKMVEYYFGNLTEDRVTFSVGRDLTLVPPQAGPPLNFFIYPYVEVEGRPYPSENVRRTFTYQDIQ